MKGNTGALPVYIHVHGYTEIHVDEGKSESNNEGRKAINTEGQI